MKFKNLFCKTNVILVFLFFFYSSISAQVTIDTLIQTDFSSGLPAGWTNVANNGNGQVWTFATNDATLDSDAYGAGNTQDASLTTSAFDVSAYGPSVKIYVQFTYQYREVSPSTATLEVFDGTSWVAVRSYNNNYPNYSNENIEVSTQLAGAANAKVRMTYTGEYSWWWIIDDFKILAKYTDTDRDGVADGDDADSDNDGIPDSIEGSCDSYSLTFQNYWALSEDPVTVSPSTPLVFGQTTVSLDRKDPQNILSFGADNTGIATQNSVLSYKIIQSSTTTDSTEHIFRFSKPVSNLVFGILDIDAGGNFTDHVVINGYAADTIYQLKPSDVSSGAYATFNIGQNSITGHTGTTDPNALSEITFPVLIDSVVFIYSNKDATPSAFQAIIFSTSFDFCDTRDTDGDRIPDYLDLDSDNDGIPDLVEIGGIDLDGDGRVDNITDADGDGLAATFDTDDTTDTVKISNLLAEGVDAKNSDTDTIPDYLDLDADNDGIADIVELGGIDADGDGRVDDLNALGDLINDVDMDGFTDKYDPDNNDTLGVDTGADWKPLVETDASGNLFNGETAVSQDT
ncbi:MAG TPA: hypothetical protein ENJ53_01815, partial [Phaeodactylibacter sp.]|nr:hypothetical protein [Phaeodactylibacter sp.]